MSCAYFSSCKSNGHTNIRHPTSDIRHLISVTELWDPFKSDQVTRIQYIPNMYCSGDDSTNINWPLEFTNHIKVLTGHTNDLFGYKCSICTLCLISDIKVTLKVLIAIFLNQGFQLIQSEIILIQLGSLQQSTVTFVCISNQFFNRKDL